MFERGRQSQVLCIGMPLRRAYLPTVYLLELCDRIAGTIWVFQQAVGLSIDEDPIPLPRMEGVGVGIGELRRLYLYDNNASCFKSSALPQSLPFNAQDVSASSAAVKSAKNRSRAFEDDVAIAAGTGFYVSRSSKAWGTLSSSGARWVCSKLVLRPSKSEENK